MVVSSLRPSEPDRLFHALADPTRRDIVRRTLTEEQSVSALARGYPMSFAAVQKHVTVLEAAGLVAKRHLGRERLVSADPHTLRRASAVIDQMVAVWQGRAERMGDILATDRKGVHR